MVSKMMRDHPKMNFKFWLKAFHHIVLTLPGLGQNMEVDPLSELETYYGSAPVQSPPQFYPHPAPTFGFDQNPQPQPAPTTSFGPIVGSGSGFVETPCTGREGTSSDKEEDILWYFREDLGLNKYHATWHNQNPWASPVQPDRRGELFFYFHRNLLARYNTERITHSMPALTTGLKLAKNITLNPGYNPGLAGFRGRQPNRRLPLDLPFEERSNYERFLGQIQTVENDVSLYTKHFARPRVHATDELGHLVESSVKSVNMARYGRIHNQGHEVLGLLVPTMPGERVPQAVMLDFHSSRDPLFYQWHASIDAIQMKQKSQLPSYQVVGGDFPLSWPNIRMDQAKVLSATHGSPPRPANTLHTFWKNRVYDGGQCRKVLDNEDFTFHFKITNTGPNRVNGTVRIFLAPSKDHNNLPLSLEQQQKFIFILDVFNTKLNPGDNAFSRSSTWTSTTSPRWNDPILQRNKGFSPNEEVLCGCGHPHNLLLPMGNDCLNGEEFDLITIVTDESIYPFTYKEDPNGQCISPPVLCGVAQPVGQPLAQPLKYSDLVLPMGYPFDGRSLKSFGNVQNLASSVPNMAVTKINIVHHDGLLSDGMTWSMLRTSRVPLSTRCQISRIIDTTTSTTPEPIISPTPTPGECWFDYQGRQYCQAVPVGYSCEFYHGGLQYCRPSVTPTPPPTPTTPTPEPCWLDYNGRRHCHEIPPGSHCTDYNGSQYCQVPTTPTQSTTTAKPSPECYYDQNMIQHCHTPPPTYTCHYSYGIKHCHGHTHVHTHGHHHGHNHGQTRNHGHSSGGHSHIHHGYGYNTTPRPTQYYNYGYGQVNNG